MNIFQRTIAALTRQIDRENKATSVNTAEASQQQTCKMCGRPDKFDFTVPDEIWNSVVPENLRNHVVCLYCFDDLASAKRIEYRIEEVFFAGRSVAFHFLTTEPDWKAIAEELYWAAKYDPDSDTHKNACWITEPEPALTCVCGVEQRFSRWEAALARYEAAKKINKPNGELQ